MIKKGNISAVIGIMLPLCLYFCLSDYILKAFGTLVKSFDFTFGQGKHYLVVCTLVSDNSQKAHTYIVNSVFTVKHC